MLDAPDASHFLLETALLLPFNATGAAFARPYIQDATHHVVAGRELVELNLVILNHPVVLFAHSFQTARILDGQYAPRRVRVLAPGTVALHVRRTDERTLLVRSEGGYLTAPFDDVFRSPARPFKNREKVDRTGLTMQIAELTDDGRPAEVEFRFSVPLEDPSLRWLQWGGSGYVAFMPPAVGANVEVRGYRLAF